MEIYKLSMPWHGQNLLAGHSARRFLAIRGQSTWHLWWTKQQCDVFNCDDFGFSLSVSFHKHSALTSHGRCVYLSNRKRP